MKIEHWYPEDRLSDRDKLEYKNMLGVCLGHIEGQGQKMTLVIHIKEMH